MGKLIGSNEPVIFKDIISPLSPMALSGLIELFGPMSPQYRIIISCSLILFLIFRRITTIENFKLQIIAVQITHNFSQSELSPCLNLPYKL